MFSFKSAIFFVLLIFLVEINYGFAAPQQQEEKGNGQVAAHLADLKSRGCDFNNPEDPFFCCYNKDTCMSVFVMRTPETEKIMSDWILKHSTQPIA